MADVVTIQALGSQAEGPDAPFAELAPRLLLASLSDASASSTALKCIGLAPSMWWEHCLGFSPVAPSTA
jgi:hypothetical protein